MLMREMFWKKQMAMKYMLLINSTMKLLQWSVLPFSLQTALVRSDGSNSAIRWFVSVVNWNYNVMLDAHLFLTCFSISARNRTQNQPCPWITKPTNDYCSFFLEIGLGTGLKALRLMVLFFDWFQDETQFTTISGLIKYLLPFLCFQSIFLVRLSCLPSFYSILYGTSMLPVICFTRDVVPLLCSCTLHTVLATR